VSQVVEKGFLAKATESEEIAKLIHFDETTKVLSVEDPQLVFYLRNLDWPEFVRRTGFTRYEVGDEYDFALTFAGEDRPFAEKLHDHLVNLGFSVFYDQSEQHRILAEDLEEFLGPIYSTKASYVVAVLGPTYGERRWTRFESEQFEKRFGENRVIPIWSTEAKPTAFDVTADIGGKTFDPGGELDRQAAEIAELCARKLDAAEPEQTTHGLEVVSGPADCDSDLVTKLDRATARAPRSRRPRRDYGGSQGEVARGARERRRGSSD